MADHVALRAGDGFCVGCAAGRGHFGSWLLVGPVAVDAAQVEKRRSSSQLNARVKAAVNEAQAKQSAEFAKVLDATEQRFETQRQADLATFLQADEYCQKQMARLEVASNAGIGQ